jgi:hypothetical protein
LKRWQAVLLAVLALYAVSVTIGVILYASGDKTEPIDTQTGTTATTSR